MKSRSKRLQIAIIIVAFVILVAVWAVNGYEDTLLYVTAIIIAIPTSWFFIGQKNKDQ